MNLIEKFAERIDSDQGYDNLSMAKDLAKISDEHYSKQCLIDGVRLSLSDDEIENEADQIIYFSQKPQIEVYKEGFEDGMKKYRKLIKASEA